MTIGLHPPPATARRLAAVAQGHQPADLVLGGGVLVNVFTEELQRGWGVAVADGRIAYVGPDAESRAGPETEVLDLAGDLLSPGLIEGHTHLTRLRLSDVVDAQLRTGVTTTVLETMELAAVCGPAGVRALIEGTEHMPGRLFFTISGLIFTDSEQDAAFTPEEWLPLLEHRQVAGVGEIYWADFLRGHPRTEALVAAALERGLAVEGHGAGARPPALNAMAAGGVGSDHESISAEDLLNRLRLGLHGMARHGATRQDLPAMAALWRDRPLDPGRLALVTDGLEPEEQAAGEGLNAVVEQAVELGLSLPRAIRLASRNVAEHFGFGRWLGGLGPGMLADLAVLPRGGGFRPRLVLVGGRPVEAAPVKRYPDWMLDTVRLETGDPALLGHPGPGRWRAMELSGPTVTREVESDGSDAIVCSVLDRLGGRRGFRGLLKGFGLQGGAFATSSAWESPGVIVAGDRPDDLAIALERVRDLRGGAAVVAGGRVLAEWEAPVAGLYSERPLGEVVEQVAAVNGAARALGCPWPNPLLTLETLTTAAIPFLRIWAGGYRRLRDGSAAGLDWEAGPAA